MYVSSTVWLLMNFFILNIKEAFSQRNVLLIIVDDLRPSLGIYDQVIHTPNIDLLAKQSSTFLRAYSQFALCAPSRNSFLTSRRPDTLRLYDFYSYWRTFAGNFTTLPQYLRSNGIDTISIGKVFHPGVSSNFSDDEKYSWSFPAWHPKTEIFKDSPVCFGKYRDLVCPVQVKEQPFETLPDIESTEEAIRVLKERMNNTKGFFLAVGFHKPHIPLKFPEKFLEYYPIETMKLPSNKEKPYGLPEVAWNPWNDLRIRDDIKGLNLTFPYEIMPDQWIKKIKQSYYACVTYVDSLIGQILTVLKQLSFDKNTVVIVTGDHGKQAAWPKIDRVRATFWAVDCRLFEDDNTNINKIGWSLGEHGEWSKYSNYENALRIPLIIKVPNLTKGDKVNHIVELLDLFPTIVDLLGLKPLPKCPKPSRNVTLCTEGKSLLPLLIDKNRIIGENIALSQYPRPGVFSTRHPDSDKPRLKDIRVMGYSIRTNRYRFTKWIQWKDFVANWSNVYGTELYDHAYDPNENHNLVNQVYLKNIKEELDELLKYNFYQKAINM